MWVALVFLTLSIGRSQSLQYDMAEFNHYYRDGKLCFNQVVLYNWSHEHKRWHVEAWWLIEDEYNLREMPSKVGGRWVMQHDGWVIYAKRYRETWTTVDPERENKAIYEEKYRVGLPPR